jgi:hypothetical protein
MRFELTENEKARADRFLDECQEKHATPHGAIGGHLTFEFTPTTIGVVTKVTYCKNMPCETSLDLTDYDKW